MKLDIISVIMSLFAVIMGYLIAASVCEISGGCW